MPGFRVAAREPTPARSGARVPAWPIRWQISQVPLVLKISSPALTSWAGVTLPPSSDSSWGGFDSICGIEFANYVYEPMIRSANTDALTPTGTRI